MVLCVHVLLLAVHGTLIDPHIIGNYVLSLRMALKSLSQTQGSLDASNSLTVPQIVIHRRALVLVHC